MKRIFAVIIALLLVCGVFAGCDNVASGNGEAQTATLAEGVTVNICDERMKLLITEQDISSATYLGYNEENKCYVVRLNFKQESIEKLANVTENNVSNNIYIFVAGEPTASHLILSAITDGRLSIPFENEALARRTYEKLTVKSDPME